MKTKRAVIFLNGSASDLSRIARYLDRQTIIIGCDGGTDHILKLGLTPNLVIGDFDSIASLPVAAKAATSAVTIGPTTYIPYPADKDFTDSELALRYAVEAGCTDIVLVGLLGDRIDHMLGNILLLLKRDFADIRLKLVGGNQEIYLIRSQTIITGRIGDTISFIPLEGEAQAKSTGLKYELSQYRLSLQHNHGISNVLTAKTAQLTIVKGSLLVVHTVSK